MDLTAKYTCKKQYRNLPAAHRQPKHDGHCALIHGHDWGFDITFQRTNRADRLDENGFVFDFGKLKEVKAMLEDTFDHTLLLNQDDPQKEHLIEVLGEELAKIVILPSCSAEGLAKYVYEEADAIVRKLSNGGVKVTEVVCHEDEKNSASYNHEVEG